MEKTFLDVNSNRFTFSQYYLSLLLCPHSFDKKSTHNHGCFTSHYFFFPRSFCEPFSATASWLMAVATEPVAMQ